MVEKKIKSENRIIHVTSIIFILLLIFMFSIMSVKAVSTLQDGLVAFYNCTEDFKDSTGRYNLTNLSGAIIKNNLCYFNTTNSRAVSTIVVNSANNNFTISAKQYVSSYGNQDILFTTCTGSDSGCGQTFLDYYTTDVRMYGYGGSGLVYTKPVVNQWNNLIFMYNKSGVSSIYINGVPVVTGTMGAMVTRIGGYYLSIGGQTGLGDVKGYLKDITIWNRTLTNTELIKISSGTTPYNDSFKSVLYSPCNKSIVMNSTGVPTLFNWSTNEEIINTTIKGKYNNITFQGVEVKTQGNNTLTNLYNGTYYLYINNTYNDYTETEYFSGCTLNVCNSDWIETIHPCTTNLRLISYYDKNNCSISYDVPLINGTYEDCVLPSDTDRELWFIILLLVVWIITIIIALAYSPFVILGSFISAIALLYYSNIYFSSVLVGVVILIATSFMLLVSIKIKSMR